MDKSFWVYILANRKMGALYCGHTDDLAKRVWQHREGFGAAHTKKYQIYRLVWCEAQATREAALTREYQIKNWKRAWKIRLIEEHNPNWDDIYLRLNQ